METLLLPVHAVTSTAGIGTPGTAFGLRWFIGRRAIGDCLAQATGWGQPWRAMRWASASACCRAQRAVGWRATSSNLAARVLKQCSRGTLQPSFSVSAGRGRQSLTEAFLASNRRDVILLARVRRLFCPSDASSQIARQPVATLKTVTTQSAVSAAVVKMTAQTQYSLSDATASAHLRLGTTLRFTRALMARSRGVGHELVPGRQGAHPHIGGDFKRGTFETRAWRSATKSKNKSPMRSLVRALGRQGRARKCRHMTGVERRCPPGVTTAASRSWPSCDRPPASSPPTGHLH